MDETNIPAPAIGQLWRGKVSGVTFKIKDATAFKSGIQFKLVSELEGWTIRSDAERIARNYTYIGG